MIRPALAAAVLAVAVLPAHAQSPWYFGASAGASRTHDELVSNRESTITDAVNLATDFDDDDRAWKAFAGLRLNSVFAIEASYVDLGEHRTFTTMLGGDPPLPASIEIRRKVRGYGFDLVATAPLGYERVRLFGRAGGFRTRLEASAALEGNIIFTNAPEQRLRTTTQNEWVFRYGLGLEWQLARNLALRAEYERYENIGRAFRIGGSGTTGEADTDMASVGIVARF